MLGRHIIEIETLTVISDGQMNGTGFAGEIDCQMASLGMFGDIVHRFLGDAIQGDMHLWRKCASLVNVHVRWNIVARGNTVGELGQ